MLTGARVRQSKSFLRGATLMTCVNIPPRERMTQKDLRVPRTDEQGLRHKIHGLSGNKKICLKKTNRLRVREKSTFEHGL